VDRRIDRLMDLPVWIESVLKAKSKSSKEESKPGAAKEGERNDAVFRFLVDQRKNGLDEESLLIKGRSFNTEYCVPPLTDEEVARIAASGCQVSGWWAKPYPAKKLDVVVSDRREQDMYRYSDADVDRLPDWMAVLAANLCLDAKGIPTE
jgi:hypothetical protein